MKEVQIPDGWRQYEPGEVRADGDRFCDPLDQQDFSRLENWGKIYTSKNYETPLVPDFVYIKPVAKSFDEKFVESLREITAKVDAMIRDIQERVQ
jgi:hypothetical protein